MYFVLEILVFIAQLFPDSQRKPVGQQKGGVQKKLEHRRGNLHGNAKDVSKSATSKPTARSKTSSPHFPSGSHGTFEIAKASDQNNVLVEKTMTDMPIHIKVDVIANGDATDSSGPEASIEQTMINVSTQTEDVVVSDNPLSNTSSLEILSRKRGAVVTNGDRNGPPASEGSIDEIKIEVPTQTQEDLSTQVQEDVVGGTSPSGNLDSGATLVSTPTEALSPSMIQQEYGEDPTTINTLDGSEHEESRNTDLLPEAQNSGHSAPFEETESALQDVGENITAADATTMVQEELLRTEQTAHQQTREELRRLEDWCKRLEDENTGLQSQVEDAGRDSARIRRKFRNAEDESTGFQTELSNAQGRMHDLMNDVEGCVSLIEDMKKQVADLNGDVTWYIQLGTNFYVRLQEAEKLLNPHDSVFAEYKRLMSEAAHYFSTPIHDDVERFEEIDEDDHSEEEEIDQENDRVPMLGTDKATYNYTPANEVDAIQAEDNVTALDDDDIPCPGRPMRPGTAKRTPISVFEAKSGDTPKKPSPYLFEDHVQQAHQVPPPADPPFPISFGFSESSVKSEEKCEVTAIQESIQEPVQELAHKTKASGTSNRGMHGRGGIGRGRGRPARGTNRGRVPPRGVRDSPSDNGVASANTGAGSSPAATAFSVNHNFSESVKAEDKREATATPIFGSQTPTDSAVYSEPVTADSNIFGNAPKVEQKQGPAQKAGNPPIFGSDTFAKSTTSTSNGNATFGEFNLNFNFGSP